MLLASAIGTRPRSKELAPAKRASLASARGETAASARQKRRALVTALGDGPGPSGGGRPSQEEAFALRLLNKLC